MKNLSRKRATMDRREREDFGGRESWRGKPRGERERESVSGEVCTVYVYGKERKKEQRKVGELFF
jgi:hypothetical protein